MALTPQQVRDAISSGQDQKRCDGHSLHLLVRNGRGYWVHRFRASDGKIHSRGVGSAATVTPAAARRDCAAFMTDKRRGVAVIPRRAKGEAFGTGASSNSPHNRKGIITRESLQATRFHTAWVTDRRRGMSAATAAFLGS